MTKIHHYFIEDGLNFIPVSYELFDKFRSLLIHHELEFEFIHRSWFCGSYFMDSHYVLCKVVDITDSSKWFSLLQTLDLDL